MIFLFSDKNSEIKKEIIEILKNYGGNYISNKKILSIKDNFTIINQQNTIEIESLYGIAVYCDNNKKFISQKLPCGFIGICEENNKYALENFKINNISVISCGMNSKNTVTLSSINNDTLFATLQRTVIGHNLNDIEPKELKIKLKKTYNSFSVMACVAILLIKGITPDVF